MLINKFFNLNQYLIMSLILCKECNSEISSEAFDCPKCGAKLRNPQRSFFGKIVKFGFIGFNILMLIWMVSYGLQIGDMMNTATSQAEKTGTTIGSGIGIMFLSIIWIAGDVVLGFTMLLTKPKK